MYKPLRSRSNDQGGFTAFQIVEYYEDKLTPEQQQRCKENISKNIDNFTNSATEDVLERTAPYILERKDYFEKKYGKAFVEKFEKYLKK